jgi:hypothetical protein
MAMYQIPQFLDEGDKVFFGMNFIQLGIFMVGFFMSYIAFAVTNQIIKIFLLSIGEQAPETSLLALVPAVPFALLFLYLSMGKFNGRDTYTYGPKFFRSLVKNPKMVYQHRADLSDLEVKFGALTYAEKERDLLARYQSSLDAEKKSYLTSDASTKAEFIRNLGSNLDDNYINTSVNLIKQSEDAQRKQDILDTINRNRLPDLGKLTDKLRGQDQKQK